MFNDTGQLTQQQQALDAWDVVADAAREYAE